MSNNGDFIPRRKIVATDYGASVHGVISAQDYDPTTIGLTDADVTELGEAVAANKALLSEIGGLKNTLIGKTLALSGRKGTHRRMVTILRKIGNKARVSNASESQLTGIGIKRKKANPSRRNITSDAPGLGVSDWRPDYLKITFRVITSSSPRARAKNSMGIQLAVVDGANPIEAGEMDRAPIKLITRSPTDVKTTGWPVKLRLYARWISVRGETSAWSSPLEVTRPC